MLKYISVRLNLFVFGSGSKDPNITGILHEKELSIRWNQGNIGVFHTQEVTFVQVFVPKVRGR